MDVFRREERVVVGFGGEPLGVGRRVLWLVVGWGAILAAGPGVVFGGGIWWLGVVGLGVWGAAAVRPGRFAWGLEWLAAALVMGFQMEWIRHVSAPILVPVGLGAGLFLSLAGPALRVLASGRLPLAAAVPLAFLSAEALRSLFAPPFGIAWLRFGHLAADWPLLLGAARLASVEGLGLALGGLAGLLAAFLVGRRGPAEWLTGLAPLALALAYALVSAPPASVPGPTLLIVQPNVPQARKMDPPSPQYLLDLQIEDTREALADLAAQGLAAPDAVVWAETMLPIAVLAEGVPEAIRAGLPLPPWRAAEGEAEDLLAWEPVERRVVREGLLGEGGVPLVPAGTAFVAGVEAWVEHRGELRRWNAVGLWDRAGRQLAGKRYLVPGAEGIAGLERFAPTRAGLSGIAGYVPDFVPAPRTGVLTLAGRDGREHRIAASVCFDNAFGETFLAPLRRGPVDAHLVLSNEAWYLDAFELDQMVAFTRVFAAASGRAVARATNSGISLLVGPDGREIARLRDAGGRDRQVSGWLLAEVPVPAAGAEAPVPPAARVARPLCALLALVAPLAALLGARRRNRAGGVG